MVDVNPYELGRPYAPRDTNMADVVAETRRIADQMMRNNPLVDATITQGLTKFRGNYGGDFAWFGEFKPDDQNLLDDFGDPQPQRGISFVRDDPGQQSAFAMYDFDPQAGVPLRQRVYMHDADGHSLMFEGYEGGRAFPDHPVVMYPRVNIEAGLTNGTDDIIWGGSGNIVGNNLQFQGAIASSGAVTITYFIRATGSGVTVDSPTRVQAGPVSVSEQFDISAIRDAGGDFADVQWHLFRSAGAGSYFPRPSRVRTWSDLTG